MNSDIHKNNEQIFILTLYSVAQLGGTGGLSPPKNIFNDFK